MYKSDEFQKQKKKKKKNNNKIRFPYIYMLYTRVSDYIWRHLDTSED